MKERKDNRCSKAELLCCSVSKEMKENSARLSQIVVRD
jgi:hypothetical protein